MSVDNTIFNERNWRLLWDLSLYKSVGSYTVTLTIKDSNPLVVKAELSHYKEVQATVWEKDIPTALKSLSECATLDLVEISIKLKDNSFLIYNLNEFIGTIRYSMSENSFYFESDLIDIIWEDNVDDEIAQVEEAIRELILGRVMAKRESE